MIYYLCPDSNNPTGGIKVIYRHVDILNKHALAARVLHQKKGFRCTWFENDTRIAYTRSPFHSFTSRLQKAIRIRLKNTTNSTIPVVDGTRTVIDFNDILVLPERVGPDVSIYGVDIPKVILNQNGFLTFKHYSFAKERLTSAYTDPSVYAVLVNSEHCDEFVRQAFPEVATERFYLSMDPGLFHFQAKKKKQICFSRIKNAADALQVINILKFRGALTDFEVIPFINISQKNVAELMRESLIFLSFGNREGFGLPAAEAMACGCITIGYHGWGGKEFFRPEFSFPIEDGDILGFAQRVEEVIKAYNTDENYYFEKRNQAAEFITEQYSQEREERELIGAWKQILQDQANRRDSL